jgi:hypothetical protein
VQLFIIRFPFKVNHRRGNLLGNLEVVGGSKFELVTPGVQIDIIDFCGFALAGSYIIGSFRPQSRSHLRYHALLRKMNLEP